MDKLIKTITIPFSELESGGWGLFLKTDLFSSGDEVNVFYIKQSIFLQSQCNSASINLYSINVSPERLRELANRLERFLQS